MEIPLVTQVRSFNRLVTERVAALNDHFLGRDHPLGEARLLLEIGPEGADVRQLRGRLNLECAYVNRMLRSLEEQGLVVVKASGREGPVRRVYLTEAGLAERAELDRRSDDFAWSLLEPLNDSQRTKLAAAMAEVGRLLVASMVTISVADPTSQDAAWCFQQYFAELNQRFDAGFDPERSISAQAHELTMPSGMLLIARLRHERVGCGALKLHESAPAELKRMWVAPSARGLGLGRRLLRELERQAREAGVTVLHLDTNHALIEAITLYRSSGYQEVDAFNDEPFAHHWFEKHL